jgi:hypothetical protein
MSKYKESMESSKGLLQIEEINKALIEIDSNLNKVMQSYLRLVAIMEGRHISEKGNGSYVVKMEGPKLWLKFKKWLDSLKYENN